MLTGGLTGIEACAGGRFPGNGRAGHEGSVAGREERQRDFFKGTLTQFIP